MNIQCKRVYDPADRAMVIAYWSTASGHAVLKKPI